MCPAVDCAHACDPWIRSESRRIYIAVARCIPSPSTAHQPLSYGNQTSRSPRLTTIMSPQPLLPADKVLAVAAALRTDGKTPHLTHGTEDKPIQLGQTQIFAVRFEDSDTWAVRIPIHQDGTLSPSFIADLVQDEIDTLLKLNEAGFRWAPKLIGSDSSFDNPLGRPYMVVSWLPGVALEWSSALTAEKRQKVLCQLADIQLNLAQCTSESRSNPSSIRLPSQGLPSADALQVQVIWPNVTSWTLSAAKYRA